MLLNLSKSAWPCKSTRPTLSRNSGIQWALQKQINFLGSRRSDIGLFVRSNCSSTSTIFHFLLRLGAEVIIGNDGGSAFLLVNLAARAKPNAPAAAAFGGAS